MNPRVLVVVPSFPSLNQPWIDTYLESLIREEFHFTVLTSVEAPVLFHDKVRRLGMLKCTRRYFGEPRRWMPVLLKDFLCRPIRILRSIHSAWDELLPVNIGLMRRIKTTLWAAYFYTVIEQVRPFDIVHVHFEDIALGFHVAVRETGRPVAMSFHGLPPKSIRKSDNEDRRYIYSKLSAVFVNTVRARDFVKKLGCPDRIIRVVPQGVPLEDFPFRRIFPPRDDDRLELLSVGRFHRDKGHAHAILAAKRLANRGMKFHWRFVGVGPNAELLRLRRLVLKLGLNHYIEFICGAELEQLQAWYRESHIFVLASIDQGPDHLIETQGVVVQEAQAVGCIPVVTATGGIPECVTNGLDALVVRPGSSRAIHDAVVWLMCNQDQWAAFTQAGRRNVEQRFSAVSVGQQMAQYLNEICAGGSHVA